MNEHRIYLVMRTDEYRPRVVCWRHTIEDAVETIRGLMAASPEATFNTRVASDMPDAHVLECQHSRAVFECIYCDSQNCTKCRVQLPTEEGREVKTNGGFVCDGCEAAGRKPWAIPTPPAMLAPPVLPPGWVSQPVSPEEVSTAGSLSIMLRDDR